jgi:GntR family transcriptional regulator
VKPSRVPRLEIAAAIREQIKSGRLAPGDGVPPLRALAEDYGVAQGTAAAAMEVLRGEGLIETVQGRGSVVVEPPSAGTNPAPDAETRLTGEIADVREYAERVHAEVKALAAEVRELRDPRERGAAAPLGHGAR